MALTAAERQIERPSARRLRPVLGWPLGLSALPLLVFLILPLLALLRFTPAPMVLHYLGDPATTQAIVLSLTTSTITALLVLALGLPAAYILARRPPRPARLLEVVIDLPTVLPPAVAGLALLMAFGRRGLLGNVLGRLGIEVAFTTVAVIMAQLFVSAPYFIKTAAVSLADVNPELEEAAEMDGAHPLQVFRLIMLPLAWRGIVGGLALCWARALGEFGATIIFAGNYPGRTQTMPLAVYIGFEIDLNQALTLAVILLAISFLVLTGVRAVLREQRYRT